MPVFERVSRYPYPRALVFDWHTRPAAFLRMHPPGMTTALTPPTDGINVGSESEIVVSHPLVAALLPGVSRRGVTGPIGVRWKLRHVELVPGELFVDEQLSGPFTRWRHEHAFADGPGGSTVITDRVTWELPVHLPGALDEALVEMQLDGMFAFRARQLRDDLALHTRLAAPPMRVVMAGASGLIGTQVAALLTASGHDVVRLVRSGRPGPGTARWDPARHRLDPRILEGADAVVNLSGHSIGGRFTAAHTKKIRASRLDSTGTLAGAAAAVRVPVWVQASAIGLYGARRPDELLTEDAAPGEGLLADVVRDWEDAARPVTAAGARAVFLRTGIVLSEGGGALAPQVPLFSIGMGGRLTKAAAWMSWIGLDDAVRGYVHALATPALSGPVNLVAPRPVSHGEFAATLGRVLHRPSAIPTPALGPKAVLGAAGYDQMIDTDQRVSAGKLVASGFRFSQGTLVEALAHALMR
ncbi:MAG: TIGR01777 family protein [Nigerium sp.]|nr:TIGR01777 family protein [Nigerium sp.]